MSDYEPYAMPKKTRLTLAIIALSLLLIVVLWLIFRSSSSELNKIVNMLNDFGYSFVVDDLFIAYDNDNISIAEALQNAELDDAVEASLSAGFPSDVHKTGGVTLILANDNGDVITVFVLDGEPELCFIQTENGAIKSLNGGA